MILTTFFLYWLVLVSALADEDPNCVMGTEAYNEKSYSFSVNLYSRCLGSIQDKSDSYVSVIYVLRGNAYEAQGLFDLAIADFSQAIRLAPNTPSPHLRRGHAYYEISQYEKAIPDLDRAIYLMAGSIFTPSTDIFQLVALNGYFEAHRYRATIECKTGRTEAANAHFLRVAYQDTALALWLQRVLKAAGFYRDSIDGLIGPATRSALSAWIRSGCP